VKYLGAYVARTAIADARIQAVTERGVTFRWRDRADGNRLKALSVSGVEFVRRYLRHVLPVGLRSIRYYGFCHPAAKANRLRIQFLAGMQVDLGAVGPSRPPARVPCCAFCQGPLRWIPPLLPPYRKRGPPPRRPGRAPQRGSQPMAA
jgi:hypothetical protein